MRRARLSRQSGLQAGSAAAGLILLATAWLFLTPDRWLGSLIPTHTAGTAFNLELLAELRASLALFGLLCLALGLFPRALYRLADHLAAPLAAVDQWLRKGRRWSVLLLACTAATAALFASYSIARHTAFNSKAYDLGLHAQVFWNTSHGRLFASSIEVNNYLGDHVSPIILLLAPLYRLWPDPSGLLVFQALVLACAALPLALLTRRLLKPSWPDGAYLASLVLALVFLSYPALGFVNRFEFHEEVLVVPLLLLAFLCLETRRPRWMSAALLLALLCKEDVGLTVAAFGLFVAWRQRDSRRIGYRLGHDRRRLVACCAAGDHPSLSRRAFGHAEPLCLARNQPGRRPPDPDARAGAGAPTHLWRAPPAVDAGQGLVAHGLSCLAQPGDSGRPAQLGDQLAGRQSLPIFDLLPLCGDADPDCVCVGGVWDGARCR